VKAEIYWIDGVPKGRLAVLPRPRGSDWLDDEVESLHLAGFSVLACLLTREEMAELDLVEEPKLCAAHDIQFVSFPILDRGVPASSQEALVIIKQLAALLEQGKSVAIHCRQGVGRSAMITACVLAVLGECPDAAFERIARARGCPVPDTPEQRGWVRTFVDIYLRPPCRVQWLP
jgi:protein-tyrosine phosphatase